MADREKMIELLSQDKAYPDCDKCKTPVGHCNRCVLEIHADHLISHGVTVRERGRWIFGTVNHREYMKCSACLKSQTPTGVFTYCPNCGAKMDGDGNG